MTISKESEDLYQEFLYAEGERNSAIAVYEGMKSRAQGPFYKDQLLDIQWYPEPSTPTGTSGRASCHKSYMTTRRL